jgi:hypothetical protein
MRHLEKDQPVLPADTQHNRISMAEQAPPPGQAANLSHPEDALYSISLAIAVLEV